MVAEQVRADIVSAIVSDAESDTTSMLPALRCIPLTLLIHCVIVEEHFSGHIVFTNPLLVPNGLSEWEHNVAERCFNLLRQAPLRQCSNQGSVRTQIEPLPCSNDVMMRVEIGREQERGR